MIWVPSATRMNANSTPARLTPDDRDHERRRRNGSEQREPSSESAFASTCHL
jgi:hypothetical protein